MNIKNYTSNVPPTTSMGNIEKWLIEIGASNINKNYKDKVCVGITFLYYDTKMLQSFAFQLKAQVDECFDILWKEVKRPNANTKQRILEQANRTAWKIVSDWAQVQCTMILLGQATPLQMFLPFIYDTKADQTLYDKVASGKMNLLLNSNQ